MICLQGGVCRTERPRPYLSITYLTQHQDGVCGLGFEYRVPHGHASRLHAATDPKVIDATQPPGDFFRHPCLIQG